MKLQIKARGGIIGTISDAIYSSTSDKLREIVANSVDAKASCVVISFSRDKKRLSIVDNGAGINNDEIRQIFESLGYGLKKHQQATLSHFGLGLISILQLAKSKAYIYSCTKDGHALLCDIDTRGFFDPKNEDQELEELGKYVDVEPAPEEEAIASSGSIIDRLLQDHKDLNINYGFDTYTEIILQDVEEQVFNDLADANFVEKLRRILPLPLQKNDEFFLKFNSKELKNKFIAFFEDENLCRTISAFMNDEDYIPDSTLGDHEDEEQNGFWKLYKYFPPFGRLREITNENLLISDSRGQDFKFYLLARVDDLFTKDEGTQGKKINGFTVRNQNFMVKENEYFDYEFLKQRLIQRPLRSWLYGEIFHKDLSRILEVSRREFLESKKEFQGFAQDFVKEVDDLSENLREAYNLRKTLRTEFLEPLREVTHGDTFRSIETKISLFCDDHRRGQVIQELSKRGQKDWFDNDTYLLENALKEEDFALLYNGVKIVISKDIDDLEDEMILQVSKDTEDNVYKLPASLFQSRKAELLGEEFDLKFVYLGAEKSRTEDPINYNVRDGKRELLINLFSDKMRSYKVNVLEIMIVVDIAHSISDGKDDMRGYLLDYLQDNYTSRTNKEIINRLGKYLAMRINL